MTRWSGYPTDGTLVWFDGIGRGRRRHAERDARHWRGAPGRGYGGRVELSFTELLNGGHARRVVDGADRLGGNVPHQRPGGASVSDRYPKGRDRLRARFGEAE